MLQLDRSAVCRLGSPTLGVPILELGFRGGDPLVPAAAPAADLTVELAGHALAIAALWQTITLLEDRLRAQDARIAQLEIPWWGSRLWVRLCRWCTQQWTRTE